MRWPTATRFTPSSRALPSTTTARTRLREARGRVSEEPLAGAIVAFDQAVVALVGQGGGGGRGGGRGRGGGAGAQTTFRSINGELMTLFSLLEDADGEPTTQAMTAIRGVQREFADLQARWSRLRTTDLAALNAKLRAAGQQPIVIDP